MVVGTPTLNPQSGSGSSIPQAAGERPSLSDINHHLSSTTTTPPTSPGTIIPTAMKGATAVTLTEVQQVPRVGACLRHLLLVHHHMGWVAAPLPRALLSPSEAVVVEEEEDSLLPAAVRHVQRWAARVRLVDHSSIIARP